MDRLTPKLVLLLVMLITSCIVLNNRVEKIEHTDLLTFSTTTNLRLHLHDGSMINSQQGVQIHKRADTTLVIPAKGAKKYDLFRNEIPSVDTLNLEEIAFVENYTKPLSLATVPATIAGYFGSLVAYAVIFGSCPTYYSESENGDFLEGEGFSYSIAPRFEEDDLDKVSLPSGTDGKVSITLRNEAWETHYINQLALLYLDHPKKYEAFSTIKKGFLFNQSKSVVLVGETIEPLHLFTRSGENITSLLQTRDGICYRSDTKLINQMISDPGTEDWINMEFEVPKDQPDFFIVLKLRNTLLNSILLYKHLLDKQNFGAIDWLAEDKNSLSETLKFYRWYTQHFGLKIDQFRGDKFVEVERLRDLGPTAWSHVALTIQTNGTGNEKIRLRFLPDNWEIDWVGISLDGIQSPELTSSPLSSIKYGEDDVSDHVQPLLYKKDKQYLVTFPGEAYQLDFLPPSIDEALSRSYFIQSEGYYTEWLRPHWLQPESNEQLQEKLVLNKELLQTLYQTWSAERDTFECHFFESKIQ